MINLLYPVTGDLITVQRVKDMKRADTCTTACNLLVISFTEAGKKADRTTVKICGLQLTAGLTLTISRIQSSLRVLIDPNQVINSPVPTFKPSTPHPTIAEPQETWLSSLAL